MRSHYLICLTLLLFSVCSLAGGSDPTLQPKLTDYKEGETWVWKYKGVTTTGEVRADGRDSKKIISQDGELFMQTAAKAIPLAVIIKPVESKTPRYSWPLQVGKKWTFEEHWTSDDGTKGATIQDAQVLSFKEETVPAGTFMAYTIKYKGKITDSRGYSADTEDVHLYAPEVKTFIKLTQTQSGYLYVEELIEYSKQ